MKLEIGDRVRLTRKYLRNTGQYTGGEAFAAWTITGFSNGGRWAIVDQRIGDISIYSEQELRDDPSLVWRRINVGNLEKVK